MNLPAWWLKLPVGRRLTLQILWCLFLVFVLVAFSSQKHGFIYAAF